MATYSMLKNPHTEKVLRSPCRYCGAKPGEPCVSKNGHKIRALGQIHDARLTTKPLRRRRLKFV